jgi:hypothetical protein
MLEHVTEALKTAMSTGDLARARDSQIQNDASAMLYPVSVMQFAWFLSRHPLPNLLDRLCWTRNFRPDLS